MKTNDAKKAKSRKPYEKLTVTKLTPEQAKLKLLGHATMGDQGAKELLELMFPDAPPKTPELKRWIRSTM